MADRNTSKIDVDLNILQKEVIESLIKFGRDFDDSATKLGEMLSGISEVAQSGGYRGDRAPTPGGTNVQASYGFAPAGIPPGGLRIGSATRPYSSVVNIPTGPNQQASGGQGVMPTPNGPMGIGGQGSFEQQYVRAQKRIGSIPVGFREALGYVRESGAPIDEDGFLIDNNGQHILDENGQKQIAPREGLLPGGKGRALAGRINSSLFTTQAVMANVSRVYGGIQGVFASVAAPTQIGMQLGYTRDDGTGGTGFMSSAFKAGIGQTWHTLRAADFGMNPNFSVADARAVTAATQQYGYSGETSYIMQDQLKQLKIHNALDPKLAASVLDPFMRFGNASQTGDQLIDSLQSIAIAAKAAGYNLSVMNEAVIGAATQIAQSTGQQPGQYINALNTFTSVTGLDPSRAVPLFTAKNMMTAAALTGKSLTSIVDNPSAAPEMQMGYRIWKGMVGNKTGAQIIALKHGSPAQQKQYETLMASANYAYLNNPDIFGGQSPLEWARTDMRNRGRTIHHLDVQDAIANANTDAAGGTVDFRSLLKSYGPQSGGIVKKYDEYMDKWLKANPKKQHDVHALREAERTRALRALGVNQKHQADKNKVQLTLTKEARRLVKLMDKNTGGKSDDNQNPHGFARDALGFGEDVVGNMFGGGGVVLEHALGLGS